MPEVIVNAYEFRIAEIGERISKALKFREALQDSIQLASILLLNLQNKVSDVPVKQGDSWFPSRQALYLYGLKSDIPNGVFYAGVEVGSKGAITRLRGRDGSVAYTPKDDDLSMRDYFFRLEMPPDSSLGFLIVQRHGRYTAANALQQCLRQKFYGTNQAARFELVTDETAFDAYLSGRVAAVKAEYVPQKKESRTTLKESRVLGKSLSSKDREDMDITMKVNRPITHKLAGQIRTWLKSDPKARPKIVKLPVDDHPDKIILCVETDDGRQKQLHPGMIADMALTVDLTAKVKWNGPAISLESANAAAAEWCSNHRAKLT